MDRKDLLNRLKYYINKKYSVEMICSSLGIEIYQLYELVLELKTMGQNYDIVENKPVKLETRVHSFLSSDPVQKSVCLLSDPHYGSIHDRPDVMSQIYAECHKRDINMIFCGGDLTDGYYPRRKIYADKQKIIGYQDMLEYIVEHHPSSRSITFYTIGGNHDASFNQSDGVDIIAEITKYRPDIVYLGQDEGSFNDGQTLFKIIHGYGKPRDDLYQKVKGYYDAIDDSEKPDILLTGHIHRSFYTKFDDTHVFQTASLLDNVSFQNGWSNECSCWFVTITYDKNGNIINVSPELKTFGPKRTRRKNDYDF